MIRSLRARLVGSMLLVTSIVVGAAMLVAEPILSDRIEADVRTDLAGIADEAAAELARGRAPTEVVERLGRRHVVQLAICDRGGQSRPELPCRGEDRPQTGDGERWVRVERAATPPGPSGALVVRAARPLARRDAARRALWQVMLIAALLAMALAIALSEYLTRSIGGPIRHMTRTADALRRGDLTTRVRSRRADELGALASSIDQMADQLVDRFEAVRREEERLRTILDAMVEGVFVTDAAGHIVLTNAALTRLAGGDVSGRTAVEAIRSAELHQAVQEATRGEALAVDFEIAVGAQRRSIAAQVAPLGGLGGGGVVAVLHDATQLKRADAVRRDFVANASHELRTPLTAIRGFAETLADGALHDERMARRFLDNITDNAKRLENLVEDLLELSRAESPDSKVELQPLDVMSVAAKVLEGLRGGSTDKDQQLTLVGDEPVIALANERALDQVLLNLVDNAIKYTPAGGRIEVGARREGRYLVLEVTDTGPGIPPQHLDRIFERFYRVDKGRSRAQGGTGLGLSIVRHLVSRMQGEVSVRSTPGEGSTFRVRLRAA